MTYENRYNIEFLEDALWLFEDELKDLLKWSTYNEDEYNEEFLEVRKLIDKIRREKNIIK